MSDEIVPKWVFEQRYFAGRETWGLSRYAVPCSCDDGGGPMHWAMVSDLGDSLRDHLALEDVRRWNREQEVPQ